MQQAWIPGYRLPFFERVRDQLDDRGIAFELVHGHPYGDDAAKGSAATVAWARLVEHRVVRVGGRHLTWQPFLRYARGADLVICEQAASQLAVYAAFARAAIRPYQRFALWGHGRNFQTGTASPVGEAVKRWISRRADWWFAYNERSVKALSEIGVPRDRITNFQNAIDTSRLAGARKRLDEGDLAVLRAQLGIDADHVAIYVGGMYREKRLPYLLSACEEIHRALPGFSMLFIGDGPEAPLVQDYVRSRPWAHFLGALFDEDKAAYVRLATLQLMPGLVGLTVLDSFALGVPLVTVADSEHSPEVAYVQDGENGVILPVGATPTDYAERVVGLLEEPEERRRLVDGCRRARSVYTLDAMVDRFVSGVEAALRAPPGRRSRRFASEEGG